MHCWVILLPVMLLHLAPADLFDIDPPIVFRDDAPGHRERETMQTDKEAYLRKELERVADLARADLARRLSIDMALITLMEARRVLWPDASAGCPLQGVDYEKTPRHGGIFRLRAGRQTYYYHWDGMNLPFLCENTPLAHPPAAPETPDEWVPPPGLDTR